MHTSVKQEKVLCRIIYSMWDFQQAMSALSFLIESCDFDQKYNVVELRKFRCFETTLIIAFSRPFKAGRGREGLNLSALGFKLTEEEQELKERLLFLRDKIIAHSDQEEMIFQASSFQLSLDADTRCPEISFSEVLFLHEKELVVVERLLRRLIKSISKYIFDCTQSDHKEIERLTI